MVGEERAVAVRDEDYSDAIGRNMRAAWLQIKKAQTRMWSQWMTVGEGLMEGRRWAMAQAGVNRPEGKGYNTALSEWLTRYGVSDMDAQLRIDYRMGPQAEEAASVQTLGFFTRLLVLSGAKDVQASFKTKSWAGDPWTLLELTWEP